MNGPSNALSDLPTARPEEVGLSRPALQRLTDAMSREIEAGRAPGVSMLAARYGKVAFSQVLGALKPGGPPMSEDALFRIYSMTKPIVSVAAMTLVEEGRLLISDPLAKYIPSFAMTMVGVETDDGLDLVPQRRPITIQDLLRHTSGLAYGFAGSSRVQKLVFAADLFSQQKTMAGQMEVLAALPLMHQPGAAWEYGHSTDVLGRVVEIVAGRSLGEYLSERIFAPLGMADTAFYVPDSKRERLAQPFSFDLFIAEKIDTIEARRPPPFEMGGTGLVSTIGDYARFAAMLQAGGALDGARILAPRTIAYMASDHLAPSTAREHIFLSPGHGFGLGFAVRVESGIASRMGSVGEYSWGGYAGTLFLVSPRDALFAIFMVQSREYLDYLRQIFRNLVYAALV